MTKSMENFAVFWAKKMAVFSLFHAGLWHVLPHFVMPAKWKLYAAPVFKPLNIYEVMEAKMKVMIITGSHRPKSNSGILADHLRKGAEEAGHSVFRFDAAYKKVHPCIGCDRCGMDGPCIFEDDMEVVRENIIPADVVVLASPMYYFGLSTQIKAVIDRFYAFNPHITAPKQAYLLVALGGGDLKTCEGITRQYGMICDFLHWKDMGRVIAPNVNAEEDVLKTPFPRQAYELGRNLK